MNTKYRKTGIFSHEDCFMMHSTKIPLITFAFWVIKIAATTLGETGEIYFP